MATQQEFEQAVSRSKELPKKPSTEDLLKLYALFKQVTEGDIKGERPGGFDFKAIAKYDAWAEMKGVSKQQALDEYVQLVDQLQQQ